MNSAKKWTIVDVGTLDDKNTWCKLKLVSEHEPSVFSTQTGESHREEEGMGCWDQIRGIEEAG